MVNSFPFWNIADRVQIHCWCLDRRWQSNKGEFLQNHCHHHHRHHHRPQNNHDHFTINMDWTWQDNMKEFVLNLLPSTSKLDDLIPIIAFIGVDIIITILVIFLVLIISAWSWIECERRIRGSFLANLQSFPFHPFGTDYNFDHHHFYLDHHLFQPWQISAYFHCKLQKLITKRNHPHKWWPCKSRAEWKCVPNLWNWLLGEKLTKMSRKTLNL